MVVAVGVDGAVEGGDEDEDEKMRMRERVLS